MSHRESTAKSCRREFLEMVGLGAAGMLAAPAAAAEPAKKRVEATAALAGIKQQLAAKDPITWVLTGDSITHGALHTLGWRSYPEHFAERVRWEMRRMRDIVINTGISGDVTGRLLGDLDWRVLRFQPDVVSIMLGMNDCSRGMNGREMYRKNLSALVEKVMAAGAIPVLNTPNTIYVKKAGSRADLPAYADIVRDTAKQSKLVLVDHYAHWEKTKPNQEDLLAWLEDQSIHPNVYGHREFAKLIFKTLEIYDANSPTCKLEVP